MNLLITGAWPDAKENLDEIRAMGHEVLFMQQEKDALPCDDGWVEGVICNGLFLFHAIERFTNLRYIRLTGVGFDRVPMEYVKNHGIEIHNAKGVYSIPMAEFVISGVLQLYKQSRFFFENQRRRKWEKHRGLLELNGKVVLIVGCGDVGTECAKRFQAFGCKVIGADRAAREQDCFDAVVALSEVEHTIPSADIVVLALGLSKDTYHLMDAERLALLRPGAVLVNVSRGGVIDTDALIAVLPNIGGAVLDVFEEEPLGESSPLWNMENVMITPHNSFVGDGNSMRLWDSIREEIK